jgi:hypothetical protein
MPPHARPLSRHEAGARALVGRTTWATLGGMRDIEDLFRELEQGLVPRNRDTIERLRQRVIEAFIFGEISSEALDAYLARLEAGAPPNPHVDR